MERSFISIFKSFADWRSIYRGIVDKLGIDTRMDEFATFLAYRYIHFIEPSLDCFKSMITGRNVVIFGAGPSLEKHINLLSSSGILDKVILVAADGATKALVEIGVVPHIVVTDLDGDLDAIVYSYNKGSKLFIHIHGDNIEVFTRFIEELKRGRKDFIVTTQVEPLYPILNFGGFTDGDRAYAITLVFKPSKIIFAGMDFGNIIGKYSKPWLTKNEVASQRKKVKLLIAFEIVSILACNTKTKTYTFSDTVPRCVERIDNLDQVHLQ
jgi:uncharacterized Rossmann fold enzyme